MPLDTSHPQMLCSPLLRYFSSYASRPQRDMKTSSDEFTQIMPFPVVQRDSDSAVVPTPLEYVFAATETSSYGAKSKLNSSSRRRKAALVSPEVRNATARKLWFSARSQLSDDIRRLGRSAMPLSKKILAGCRYTLSSE